jgi:transglycosylase-like protein with SLT domain
VTLGGVKPAQPGATLAAEGGESRPGGTDAGKGQPREIKGDKALPSGPAADDPRSSKTQPGGIQAGEGQAGATKAGDTKAGDGKAGEVKAGDGPTMVGDKAVVTVATASGGRATRVLRRANPVRVARSAGRSTSAWAKRPTGRLLIPAIIAVLLLGAAGTAGAYLVPEALQAEVSPSATPDFPLGAGPGAPAASGPIAGLPTGVPGSGLPTAPGATIGGLPTNPGIANGVRPADALASWAQQAGTRVGIPVVAVQAYGYAELVQARSTPNCHLNWTTIAAIAKVESAHGSANGAVLGADGSVQPPIYGLPLDGKGGRQLIRDTDQGVLDGDTTYDRAIGPLQFIPSTWRENAVDADNSGAADPNDIDDASLTTAVYLCKNGRDMSKADAWWDAILSYNAVRPYAQKVFDAANEYGQRSRV